MSLSSRCSSSRRSNASRTAVDNSRARLRASRFEAWIWLTCSIRPLFWSVRRLCFGALRIELFLPAAADGRFLAFRLAAAQHPGQRGAEQHMPKASNAMCRTPKSAINPVH